MDYYISKKLQFTFDYAVELTKTALEKEGFDVIIEMDIRERLKEKLDVDFRKYKILEAFIPEHSYRALQLEDKIGAILPCNVIVQELGNYKTEVAVIDLVASMLDLKNEKLVNIAYEIREKLERVFQSLDINTKFEFYI